MGFVSAVMKSRSPAGCRLHGADQCRTPRTTSRCSPATSGTGVQNKFCRQVLSSSTILSDEELRPGACPRNACSGRLDAEVSTPRGPRRARIRSLAESNYEVAFSPDTQISQRSSFRPRPQSQRHRGCALRPFQNEDGSFAYYATLHATTEKFILPPLLETRTLIQVHPLTSRRAEQGMALFPRKTNATTSCSLPGRENIMICPPKQSISGRSPRCCSRPPSRGIHKNGQLRFADLKTDRLVCKPRRRRDAEVLSRAFLLTG